MPRFFRQAATFAGDTPRCDVHTGPHGLKSPPTALLFSALSTRINLHWLIKRLLKIRLALGRVETNNAEQGSTRSITWGATFSQCAEDWQYEGRIVLWAPRKWLTVNKRVKICTVSWPQSPPHWAIRVTQHRHRSEKLPDSLGTAWTSHFLLSQLDTIHTSTTTKWSNDYK